MCALCKIGAACDQIHAVERIIHDDREVIGGSNIPPGENDVAMCGHVDRLFASGTKIAPGQIADEIKRRSGPKAPGGRHSLIGPASRLGRGDGAVGRHRRLLRRGQNLGKLGAGQIAGIDKIARPQAGKSVLIGGKTVALEHRLATPGQVKKFEIPIDLFGEFGTAPRVVYIVDPQDISVTKARGDKRRIGMAEMQQAGRAWRKPRYPGWLRGSNAHDFRVPLNCCGAAMGADDGEYRPDGPVGCSLVQLRSSDL